MANAEVGSAYVTIMPAMDKSFGTDVKSALSSTGTEGGNMFGEGMLGSFAGMATKIIAALGLVEVAKKIGEVGKQALDAYASYEQLSGGVDKLFGDAADTVRQNAQQAFETAGMSANDYMETVTGFSASLLQSVGGDTQEAAKQADKAIRDMSDNANTFGTDIQSIQNAYGGFAKGQFTMLDNLKLGYGGTKEEMQRLLDDAEAISGVHYDISSYSDIVDAIHEVQDAQHIAGTTANEAAGTVEGSVGAMKASWTNFLTELGKDDADLDAVTQQLANSVVTAAKNVVKVIFRIITNGVKSFPKIIKGFYNVVKQNLPEWIKKLKQLLSDAWDAVKRRATEAWNNIKTAIVNKLNEAKQAISDKWNAIKTDISNRVNAIKTDLTNKWNAIKTTVTNVVNNIKTGVINAWNNLKTNVTNTVNGIKTNVVNTWNGLKTSVLTIVDGVKTGITNTWNNLKTSVSNTVTNIKNTVTNTFNNLKTSVSNTWNNIKTAITKPIEDAKQAVSGVIDRLKGLFPINVGNILSGIKTPHFSINWTTKTILGKDVSWPSGVGVEWYAKGAIFSKPTVLSGVGEAGPEMVLPQKGGLMTDFAQEVTAQVNTPSQRDIKNAVMDAITEMGGLSVVLDGKSVGYGLSPYVNRGMGNLAYRGVV